jgi:membrane-associated protease RseP (regulator of RpoE activity)
MDRDRALVLGVIVFACLAAALYWLSFDTPPTPSPAAPAPATEPAPRARKVPTPSPREAAAVDHSSVEAAPIATPEAVGDVTVTGQVLLSDGTAAQGAVVSVRVGKKNTTHEVGPDGEFEVTIPPGPARLRATRPDGKLQSTSGAVRIDGSSGADIDVMLTLPAEKRGGLGIRVVAGDGGLRILRVEPGSPAEGMGLSKGDIVVGVDGRPTAGWGSARLARAITGPVGSTQVLSVRHEDGSEVEYGFTRDAVD